MIRIENTAVSGWEAAIRGMRNPLNSWDRSDSMYEEDGNFLVGDNNLALMKTLASAGTEHAKYLRFVTVTMDITAPLYWWKEFDTYRAGVEKNSCSTMHRIASRPFTIDDFSCEHLMPEALDHLLETINILNMYREKYKEEKNKAYWWQLIQLLPESYHQRRTVQASYQALKSMYEQREGHKLDEWHEFRSWVESLPYSEIITGGKKE